MTLNVTIQKPCSENWESMRIGLHSRFCENCIRDVVDFTNKDRKEILEYLIFNHDKKICGRVYPSQIDFSKSDFLVTIKAFSERSNNPNLSFYLLAMGSLILAGCNNNSVSSNSALDEIVNDPSIKITNMIDDSTKNNTNTIDKLDTTSGETMREHLIAYESIIMGDFCVFPEPAEKIEPLLFVKVMPEFKGGVDSLMSFIKQKLVYPAWERNNKIHGKVIVTFVVDKNGKIKDPKILKSVEGSKYFNHEVIRVVNSMPDWRPGWHDGKNVDVQFTLPIEFQL